MRRLLARGLWRLVGRRLGWVAAASVARTVLRLGASRKVDDAAAEIDQRLPEPVRSALTRLPGDPVRLGGRAVVAGRSARQVAVGAGRASRSVEAGRRRLSLRFGQEVDRAATAFDGRPRPVRRGRSLARRLGDDVAAETEDRQRDLRSRMLANSRGLAAADDALLDRRLSGNEIIDRAEVLQIDDVAEELPPPPRPVRPGRLRAPRRRAREQVARVQRTYHQPRRPWDR